VGDDIFDVWTTAPLGDLVQMRRGITYDSSQLAKEDEGIAYINMKSFLKGGGFNREGTKTYSGTYSPSDLVQANDVFLANTDVTSGDIVGVPALLPADLRHQPVLFSHHVTRLHLSKNISPEFLYYSLCLPEYRGQMLRIARGTTVLMLDMQALKRVPIRFPAEQVLQQRIAEILSTVDEAIEQTEALIAKTQAIKAGDLFTRGVLPNGRLRPPREEAPELYKESVLGWIPVEWECKSLAQWTAFITDYRGMTPPYTSEGIPVISAENIGDGKIKSITKYVTEETYNLTTTRGFPEPGDVVFTTEAPVAEVARLPLHGTYRLTRRVIALRPKEYLHKSYAYWSMYRLSMMGAWNGKLHGSTVPRILKPDILAQHLAAPSKDEQEGIAYKLDQIEERLDTEIETEGKLESLKRGLMHNLLTGRARVTAAHDKGRNEPL